MTATFAWDRNYKNIEQVRPYFPAYTAIRTELDAAGKFHYNDRFMGRIPGLAGSPDEETGVYLLQTMHDLEQVETDVEAFTKEGGQPLDQPKLRDLPQRGTLACWGWFSDGTGWSKLEDHRVSMSDHGQVLVKAPRERKWRILGASPRNCLFIADPKS